MDNADLYDYEMAAIGKIWVKLNQDWSRRANDRNTLQEFAKNATDEFLKAGFVVNVQWENTLIVVPDITAPGGVKPLPVTIEVLGRAGINQHNIKDAGFELMDHERKRDEVLKSKERGEDFLGQSGKK